MAKYQKFLKKYRDLEMQTFTALKDEIVKSIQTIFKVVKRLELIYLIMLNL